MVAFYASQKSVTKINRIGRLTLAMLGPKAAPVLKAKAMETHCLVPLMADLLNEHGRCFGLKLVHLQSCVTNLLRLLAVIKREPRSMTRSGIDTIQRCMCSFLDSWKKAGGHCVFKHHMSYHVVEHAVRLGNPRFYHTYSDEEENRAMGLVAKKLHGSRKFYLTFLQRIKIDVC